MDQNSQYKEILDKVFDGVYLVDRERRITFWNKGAERITGFHADSVVGKKCAGNSSIASMTRRDHQKQPFSAQMNCCIRASAMDAIV